MQLRKWLDQPSTRWAIGLGTVLSVAYLLVLIARFAPESTLHYVESIIFAPFSYGSGLIHWYWFGGFVLYVGVPLVLLLRFRLLVPLLLVVLEQYQWYAFNPINQGFGTSLLVLLWPAPVALFLVLGWIEYRIHVGLGLPAQPLVRG